MKKAYFFCAVCSVLLLASLLSCGDDDDFEVRYTSNGATVGSVPVDPATYEDGAIVTVLGNMGKNNDGNDILEKDKHRFVGWTIKSDTSENPIVYNEGDSVMIDFDNIIFVAKWEYDDTISVSAVTYTVEHYQQNIDDDDYVKKDSQKTKAKAGATTAALAKSYTGFTAKPFEQATVADDSSTVIKIYYDRNTHSISFDANAGEAETSGVPQAQTNVKFGATISLGSEPTCDGKAFLGWAKTTDAAEAPYTTAFTLTDDADVTLYAVWEDKTP